MYNQFFLKLFLPCNQVYLLTICCVCNLAYFISLKFLISVKTQITPLIFSDQLYWKKNYVWGMENLNWRKNCHVTIAQAFFNCFVEFSLNIILIATVKITIKKNVIIDIQFIYKLKISFIVYPFIEEGKSFLYF